MRRMFKSADKTAAVYLGVLILFTALLRIFSPQMIGTGGIDAMESWYQAKTIFYGLDYSLDHRSARFAAIIPQYAAAVVFGRSAVSYYIAPAAASLVLTVFLFLAARLIRGNLFAFIVTTLVMIFPQMLIDASHPRASTFSTPLLCVVLFVVFSFYRKCEKDRNVFSLWYLAGAAVFTFFMYMAKEDSLYFLPTIMLILLLARNKLSDPFIYGVILFSFYIGETLAYNIFTDYPFGRLQVIRQGHLNSVLMIPVPSFFNLFDRFRLPNMQPYFTWTIIVSLVSGLYLAVKKWKSGRMISLVYIALINYLVLMTFLLKSVSPLVPANTFRTRYLAIITPLLMIIIVYFIFEMYELIIKKTGRRFNASGVCIPAVIICAVIIAAGGYGNSVMSAKKTNPLIQTPKGIGMYAGILRTGDEINRALDAGTPVVFNAYFMERYRDILGRIDALKAKGFSEESAAKQCGLSLETYKQYVAKFNNAEYNALFPVMYLLWNSDVLLSDTTAKYPDVKRFDVGGKTFGMAYIKGKTDPAKMIDAVMKNKKTDVLFIAEKPFGTAIAPFEEVYTYAK